MAHKENLMPPVPLAMQYSTFVLFRCTKITFSDICAAFSIFSSLCKQMGNKNNEIRFLSVLFSH